MLSANAFNSSASFPERAPLAQAAQFHPAALCPLRLRHDLHPNIGLLAIQHSASRFACFQAWLAPRMYHQRLQQHHAKQYSFPGFMILSLACFTNASSESAASPPTTPTLSKASQALSWPAPGRLSGACTPVVTFRSAVPEQCPKLLGLKLARPKMFRQTLCLIA